MKDQLEFVVSQDSEKGKKFFTKTITFNKYTYIIFFVVICLIIFQCVLIKSNLLLKKNMDILVAQNEVLESKIDNMAKQIEKLEEDDRFIKNENLNIKTRLTRLESFKIENYVFTNVITLQMVEYIKTNVRVGMSRKNLISIMGDNYNAEDIEKPPVIQYNLITKDGYKPELGLDNLKNGSVSIFMDIEFDERDRVKCYSLYYSDMGKFYGHYLQEDGTSVTHTLRL